MTNINTARFQKFDATHKGKNKEVTFKKLINYCDLSTLPPCNAELYQHLLRAQYITSIWRKAYLRCPTTLIPDGHGWQRKSNTLEFQWWY